MENLDDSVELRDSDVFDQLTYFFNNEKSKDDSKFNYDLFIELLIDIKTKLTTDFKVSIDNLMYAMDDTLFKASSYKRSLYDDFNSPFGINFNSGQGISYEQYIDYNRESINNDLRSIYNYILYASVVKILEAYLTNLESFGFIKDSEFVNKFGWYLSYLNKNINKINNIPNDDDYKHRDILRLIMYPFITDYQSFIINPNSYLKSIINNLFYLTRDIVIEDDDFKSFNLVYPRGTIEGFENQFDLKIRIRNNANMSSNVFMSYSLILGALERIDGVYLDMDSIHKGSVITRFKIFVKDLVSKELFKNVVIVACDLLSKTFTDSSVTDTLKNQVEIEKEKLEIQRMKKEIEALPVDLIRSKNEIGVEKDRLDNEKLAMEVLLLKKEARLKDLEYIDKLSQLLAKGIIESDIIEIELDDIPIIVKRNGRLEIGNIDQVIPEE